MKTAEKPSYVWPVNRVHARSSVQIKCVGHCVAQPWTESTVALYAVHEMSHAIRSIHSVGEENVGRMEEFFLFLDTDILSKSFYL